MENEIFVQPLRQYKIGNSDEAIKKYHFEQCAN